MPDFEIVHDPATSPAVGRHVVRQFFTPRELPMAMLRALRTPEFILFVGAPVVVLSVGRWLLDDLKWLRLAGVVAAWLVAGAVWMLTLGKGHGIGCYDGGRLVGGLRMKVSRRRMWLAGILVDPACRGNGMFPALLLGAFRMAAEAARERPLTVSVFAPAHPASRRVVEKYFDGKLFLPVDPAAGSAFARTLAKLEAEVKELEGKGIRYTFRLLGRL